MFNGKFVMALVTIVMTVFAICRLGNTKGVKENFGAGLGNMMTYVQMSDCKAGWKTNPEAVQQAALTAQARAVGQKLNIARQAGAAAVKNSQQTTMETLQVPASAFVLSKADPSTINSAVPQNNAATADTVSAAVLSTANKNQKMSLTDQVATVSGVNSVANNSVAAVAAPLKEGFVNPNGPRSGDCGFKQADFYQVPGFIQKAPPPRGAASVGYGPNITYNPPRQNMARSYDYADMVKENYQPRQGCNDAMRTTAFGSNAEPVGGRVMLAENYINNKTGYDEAIMAGNIATDAVNNIIDSSIPVNGMENVSPDGEIVPAIVCNLMTAINRPKHRIAQGDPIRGDLPIPPPCGNWFTSSHNTSGLNNGAMNVLGGNNAIDNELLALKQQYSPDGTHGVTVMAGDTVTNNLAVTTLAAVGGGAAQALVASANVPLSVSPN